MIVIRVGNSSKCPVNTAERTTVGIKKKLLTWRLQQWNKYSCSILSVKTSLLLRSAEAAPGGVLWKKAFVEMLQNSIDQFIYPWIKEKPNSKIFHKKITYSKTVWNKLDQIWDTNVTCYEEFKSRHNSLRLYSLNLSVCFKKETGKFSPLQNIC